MSRLLHAEKMYGVIGHPVGHSLSPLMHNDQFQHQSLPAFYHAFDVMPEYLGDALQGLKALGVSGFNVTVPHKIEVMQYLDGLDEEARLIGAVNTIVKEEKGWIGYNTDGDGYVQSLLSKVGSALPDSNILVIGAGGAARAVISALTGHKAEQVTITNRTFSKAEALQERMAERAAVCALPTQQAEKETPSFDIIINTTSVGMSPQTDRMPWPVDGLKPGCVVSDLIYNPLKTKWLQEAQKRGADILNGTGMFVGQGAIAFEKWTGIQPDTKRMHNVVMKQLGGN
ncbi:shikimate dehydrogenase [Salibacterium halotolerans]|uniref:Shikimate dehydrogenase (NADP(+)) n=1 Tax=Salibacterium halotolerans TaxID=1884432 RepID=A0A1I5NDY7_9BACI|nr:shikimate dehydrogenase [Salibacterium halotolerans]SFP19917.1 shikimate dehydrogenase [Salibacterium halotolerans]